MTRFLARLLVRLLRAPEVQAELRQAVAAAQAEEAFNTTLVGYDSVSDYSDRTLRKMLLGPNSQP